MMCAISAVIQGTHLGTAANVFGHVQTLQRAWELPWFDGGSTESGGQR